MCSKIEANAMYSRKWCKGYVDVLGKLFTTYADDVVMDCHFNDLISLVLGIFDLTAQKSKPFEKQI